MKKKIISFFVLITNLFFYQPLAIAESSNYDLGDEIIVKYKDKDEFEVIKVGKDEIQLEVLDYYNNRQDVEYAELNHKYNISLIPNDTYYGDLWYLKKIKAPQAWDSVSESPKITIAIIDSGIQIDHPDLQANIWQNKDEIPDNGIDDDKNGFIDDVNGWDFVNNVYDPSPKFTEGFTESGILHGTIVAGIAAASGNNSRGVTGVTWNTKIMPLKALNDEGEGRTSEVIRAIDYAIANGADVINFSFVGFGFSQGLEAAIERAYNAGIILVAAAGNEQDEGDGYNLDQVPMYPACHDGSNGENMVIGVAATDTMDQKANFSSYGSACVDIAAPGISILSTSVYEPNKSINNKYFNKYYDGYWSGTSMAAPIVSGAVALLESVDSVISPKQVFELLLDSADNINKLNPNYVNKLGTGRLNLEEAVNMALALNDFKNVELITSPLTGLQSIKISDKDGVVDREFFAYDSFSGGVNVASADLDGDGVDEIITGAGFGGGPQVRIFNAEGEVLGQFFAYNSNFRGGVNVTSGDLDGDGIDEIITGAGNGGGPQVRIFNAKGEVLGQFFAYDSNFRGGVNVASGDLDGDGVDEIITGAGVGGGPQVRIFNNKGKVLGQFFAYDSNFRGGVNVAVGNIDIESRNFGHEIITSPGAGGGPHIRIFNANAVLKKEFFAYNDQYRGGVQLATGDLDGDGVVEIVTAMGEGNLPYVRVFKTDGVFIGSFYAYDEEFDGGVNVGVISIKN